MSSYIKSRCLAIMRPIIFRNNLTWDAGLFTSSYFNECLQFNLQKSTVKALLSVTELKSLTTEVINKEEFGLTNPQMRRARRKTDQKRKPEEIEKESQFIYLITQLVAEIIKSDIQNERINPKTCGASVIFLLLSI